MTEFIMLVGISGSGKSTWSKRMKSIDDRYTVLSSDEIREEILGDKNDQSANAMVFEEMNRRTIQCLKNGKSVIYDATNLSMKRRMALLRMIDHSKIDSSRLSKQVIVFPTPYHVCALRQSTRKRKVPTKVLYKQICQFQMPAYYEGWDYVMVVTNSDETRLKELEFLASLQDIPHDNPNHSLMIKEHCGCAGEYCIRNFSHLDRPTYNILTEACFYHDIGKFFTKRFLDNQGNDTNGVAHFYSHQNVSAYIECMLTGARTMGRDEDNIILLIQWHMERYLRKGEAYDKFEKIIGKELSRNLDIVHECDMKAH